MFPFVVLSVPARDVYSSPRGLPPQLVIPLQWNPVTRIFIGWNITVWSLRLVVLYGDG